VVELPTRKVLTIELAKRLASTAKSYARRRGHPRLIVVIVDPGGHLLYLERMDGVSPGTVQVATLKAQSAVAFGVESKHFEDGVAHGLVGLVGLPGMAAFEGAVPIRVDGQVIGALAISGLTKELDGEIARAAVAALPRILGT
jgi:glc operon protein GlcG